MTTFATVKSHSKRSRYFLIMQPTNVKIPAGFWHKLCTNGLTDEHPIKTTPTTSQDPSSCDIPIPSAMIVDAPEVSDLDLLDTATPRTESSMGQGNWDSGHESSESDVEQLRYNKDCGCTDTASRKRTETDSLIDEPSRKKNRLTATEDHLSSDVKSREMLEDKSIMLDDSDEELDYEDCGDVSEGSCGLDDGVVGVVCEEEEDGASDEELYDGGFDCGYDDVVVVDGDDAEKDDQTDPAVEVDGEDGEDSGHADDGLEDFLSELNSVELIGEISDSSEDEDDSISCPDSCICKSGRRDISIPCIDRRFETIRPLREKLLTRQTLSWNKLQMSSCCDYECCLDWERISADEVVWDYHPSDLSVLHFNWGCWKSGTEQENNGESDHSDDDAVDDDNDVDVEEEEQMNETDEVDMEDGGDAADGLEDFLSDLNSVDLIGEISDSSEDEDDCPPCPDSCICKSGQREICIPDIDRRFRKIRPLREKLLTWQTLRWNKLLTSSCCDRKCYLNWNTISGRRVVSAYHPSDLNVLHFSWGCWKASVTDASGVDDYPAPSAVTDHRASERSAMKFSSEDWIPDVLDDADGDDEDYLSWTS